MRRPSRAGASSSAPCVLVVSADTGLREQVAAWVDEAGYTVIVCPGPHPPVYSCVGLRGERCPLDAAAALTVLDLDPMGPGLDEQSGRAALVELYQSGGRPVLVLADEQVSDPQYGTAGAAFLERTADQGALLASVRELLGSHA